jgi:hypothetical protein
LNDILVTLYAGVVRGWVGPELELP